MLYQLSYNGPAKQLQILWWTGKDSNLRTSQGGTDLQSVGFNHSPTCPVRHALPPDHQHNEGNDPNASPQAPDFEA